MPVHVRSIPGVRSPCWRHIEHEPEGEPLGQRADGELLELDETEMESSVPETRIEARRRVFDYIEAFYNSRRRHSTLGHVSPNQLRKRRPD